MAGDLDNLRVVLVATRNPLNIGAAARAMRNFGVRRLRVGSAWREEDRSMNLGQAVAVCLYELVRGRKRAPAKSESGKKEKTAATSRELERLTQAMLKVLHDSGYVKPRAVAAEEKLRRLVRRMGLNGN